MLCHYVQMQPNCSQLTAGILWHMLRRRWGALAATAQSVWTLPGQDDQWSFSVMDTVIPAATFPTS